MATSASSGSIDLDKPGKYPIVLSDALLGRGTKETYTSLRYNHKPSVSSSSSFGPHELKPVSGNDSSLYDLSFSDGDEQYAYRGIRNSGDGQYVLIFDPAKKHFVLHQVDSTFDMNLTSTPWDQDPDSLRDSYPQLEPPARPRRKSSSRGKSQPGKEDPSPPAAGPADGKGRKNDKSKKSKSRPREPTPDAEDEDEVSDDGLTIEYPGGAPPPRFQSRGTPLARNTQRNVPSEPSDVDAEYDDNEVEQNHDVEDLKLPSPAGNNGMDEEDELELDLEAELEQALASETGNRGDESSESEEE